MEHKVEHVQMQDVQEEHTIGQPVEVVVQPLEHQQGTVNTNPQASHLLNQLKKTCCLKCLFTITLLWFVLRMGLGIYLYAYLQDWEQEECHKYRNTKCYGKREFNLFLAALGFQILMEVLAMCFIGRVYQGIARDDPNKMRLNLNCMIGGYVIRNIVCWLASFALLQASAPMEGWIFWAIDLTLFSLFVCFTLNRVTIMEKYQLLTNTVSQC